MKSMNKEHQANKSKKALANSSWLVFSKVINMAVGFIASVLLTRYLGAEQKGILSNAQALSSVFSFVASFGLLDIVVSQFSSNREQSSIIAASSMTLMFVCGIVAFFLSIITSFILKVDIEIVLYVSILSSNFLFQFMEVFSYWFYSNSISKNSSICQSIIHIFFIILKVAGIVLKRKLVFFVIIFSLENILIYFSYIFCYKKSECFFEGRFKPSIEVIKKLIKYAFPMVIQGFAISIYMKIDQIMVGKIIGNVELGYYSVAVNLAEYWYFIPSSIYISFLPVLSAYFFDKKEFEKKLQEFTDIVMTIGYLAIIVFGVFGKYIIYYLYGSEFLYVSNVLLIYIWTGLFTCLSFSGQAYYVVKKETKTIMYINILEAIINLVLNMLLIKELGSIGAALATLIDYVIVCFGQMIILGKNNKRLYKIQIKSFFPFKRIHRYIITNVRK